VVCAEGPNGVQTDDELDGSAPQPTLYMNGTKEARWAKGLLEQYAIDLEERHTSDPLVCLHWSGTTYTDRRRWNRLPIG
jgi:hypothetical protein